MTVMGLVKFGTFERRLAAARRTSKSWNYRLVKSRAIIVHEDETNALEMLDR